MEVRIRLQRIGKSAKKRYNYRIVAIKKDVKRDSRNLEILGHYDPSEKPVSFSIDHDKLAQWIKKGAQMSDTVRSLVKKTKKS
ncbi:MAG: 30S ribosomal protein S16 [Candidatus Omnitrophica bacterium]|nr:30S ribosomal protein S16 [Candidatus Omnitrophota bacterium]